MEKKKVLGTKLKKRALMLASVASMLDLFNEDNISILTELGYKVDVAANFKSGSVTSQKRVDEYKQELIRRGISVYDIPIPRSLSMVTEMGQSYQYIRQLADRNKYSVVHCHSPIGGVLCRLACINARKHGTKVIYTAHGFHFFKGASCKAWMFFYPVEYFCANFTDVLITINREDYERGRRFRAGRVVYVPGIGIHTDEIQSIRIDKAGKRAELGLEDSDFVFMSTGQISVRKNHQVVIRAMKKIKNQNVKYLIAGFGELEEKLQCLVTELGLENRVIFAGYRSDVKELLHAVDAFVFPSIQEGLPVALMEAMAVGLPIVASRIRGNVDLIEDGFDGYLAECHDAAGFADAMEKIVQNRNMKEMTYNLQKKIERFDTDNVNKCMKSIYRNV